MNDVRRPDRRSSARRSVPVFLIGIAVTGLLAAGCSSSSASSSTSSTADSARHLVGRRYCEVLLVHTGSSGLYADVYNSYPLNSCPADKWKALDATTVAKDNGALAAELNGPRYWLMDSIEKIRTGKEVVKTFGGIAMIAEATVGVGDLATAARPYVPHPVDRKTVFSFDAGRQIYELVEPDGTRWVMQTWSQIKDPTLGEADLAGLGPRLALPAGWRYVVRRISTPLRVVTTSTSAQVLQDDFANSYSEENS